MCAWVVFSFCGCCCLNGFTLGDYFTNSMIDITMFICWACCNQFAAPLFV